MQKRSPLETGVFVVIAVAVAFTIPWKALHIFEPSPHGWWWTLARYYWLLAIPFSMWIFRKLTPHKKETNWIGLFMVAFLTGWFTWPIAVWRIRCGRALPRRALIPVGVYCVLMFVGAVYLLYQSMT